KLAAPPSLRGRAIALQLRCAQRRSNPCAAIGRSSERPSFDGLWIASLTLARTGGGEAGRRASSAGLRRLFRECFEQTRPSVRRVERGADRLGRIAVALEVAMLHLDADG